MKNSLSQHAKIIISKYATINTYMTITSRSLCQNSVEAPCNYQIWWRGRGAHRGGQLFHLGGVNLWSLCFHIFFLQDIQSGWGSILLLNILRRKFALGFYTIQTKWVYTSLPVISEQLVESWSDPWSCGNTLRSPGNCDLGSFWQPNWVSPSGADIVS